MEIAASHSIKQSTIAAYRLTAHHTDRKEARDRTNPGQRPASPSRVVSEVLLKVDTRPVEGDWLDRTIATIAGLPTKFQPIARAFETDLLSFTTTCY